VRNRQQFLGDNHLVSGIGYQECLDQKPENQSPEPRKLATTDPNHRSFVDAPETTHSELIKSEKVIIRTSQMLKNMDIHRRAF
jgi:hypothetical protein